MWIKKLLGYTTNIVFRKLVSQPQFLYAQQSFQPGNSRVLRFDKSHSLRSNNRIITRSQAISKIEVIWCSTQNFRPNSIHHGQKPLLPASILFKTSQFTRPLFITNKHFNVWPDLLPSMASMTETKPNTEQTLEAGLARKTHAQAYTNLLRWQQRSQIANYAT